MRHKREVVHVRGSKEIDRLDFVCHAVNEMIKPGRKPIGRKEKT